VPIEGEPLAQEQVLPVPLEPNDAAVFEKACGLFRLGQRLENLTRGVVGRKEGLFPMEDGRVVATGVVVLSHLARG